MKDYSRFGRETVESIAVGLTTCKSASELARNIGVDVSGLIKHIKKFRALKTTSSANKCGLKKGCRYVGLCKACPHDRPGRAERKLCAHCQTSNCNQSCPVYTPIPNCPRLGKFPYVCDGCEAISHCWLSHYRYMADEVWPAIREQRREPRKGVHAGKGSNGESAELTRLSLLLAPLIKEKHQSLPQIYAAHKDEIRWSYPTLLKLIDLGKLPGISNIDLTKRVRYPKSYRKSGGEPTNAAFLSGRTYDDFVSFVTENRGLEVVEMDTVLSCRGSSACLLTLLFRRSNFMLAFLLRDKTVAEVNAAFALMRKALGCDLYKRAFAVMLTDNGSEFADPRSIEFDPGTGERVTRLFYCDPGKSGQKGKIEKNHVEVRKVFPKGTDFALFDQGKVNVAMRHVNSEPRAVLNGNSPGEIARAFLDEKVLALNEYSPLDADSVFLHPDLFK